MIAHIAEEQREGCMPLSLTSERRKPSFTGRNIWESGCCAVVCKGVPTTNVYRKPSDESSSWFGVPAFFEQAVGDYVGSAGGRIVAAVISGAGNKDRWERLGSRILNSLSHDFTSILWVDGDSDPRGCILPRHDPSEERDPQFDLIDLQLRPTFNTVTRQINGDETHCLAVGLHPDVLKSLLFSIDPGALCAAAVDLLIAFMPEGDVMPFVGSRGHIAEGDRPKVIAKAKSFIIPLDSYLGFFVGIEEHSTDGDFLRQLESESKSPEV